MRNVRCPLLNAGLLLLPLFAPAAETPLGTERDLNQVDKSHYTLWNPTPRKYLRDMEAQYLSPYTVDAGHVQTEICVVDYAYDHDTAGRANTRTESWRVAPTTLKLGVLNDLDLELEIAPYSRVRTVDRVAGRVTVRNGFGDLIPKAKLNLWGNDSGSTALALLPFVQLPTGQDDLGDHAVEGGLVLPAACELPWDWWLALSPEFDCEHDLEGSGYHFEFANTLYLGHDIVGDLSGYVEFSSAISAERGSRWLGAFAFGLSYVASRNMQLDGGVIFGVTSAAPDINPFLGISFRF